MNAGEKTMKPIQFIFILIIGILTLNLFLVFTLSNQEKEIYNLKQDIDIISRYKMYDKDIKLNQTINGVYFSSGYYTVWTKGRTESDINRTDYHEVCHELIHKDKRKHFCKI